MVRPNIERTSFYNTHGFIALPGDIAFLLNSLDRLTTGSLPFTGTLESKSKKLLNYL